MPPAVRTRRARPPAPSSRLPPAEAAARSPTRRASTLSCRSPPWTRAGRRCHPCPCALFPAAAAHQQQVSSDVDRGLSSSLVVVLPAFHTLSGELAYSPELGTVTICGEDAGVAFVEAETDLDLASLVGVVEDDDDGAADLDVEALSLLVPDIRREELPAPMFAAQVTEFAGGIALGVALNHVATDGIGFFRFMQMWAASTMAAGATNSSWTWTEPLHDRRFVRFDGAQELARRLLRQAAPDLPRIVPKQQGPTPTQQQLLLSRRTFTFSAHALRRLKQRLTVTAAGPGAASAPSTLATLAAHSWVSFAVASGFTDAAPVFAVLLADCRAHMSPPVPDAYAGNCVVSCVVALSGAELTGADDGPARAFLAIRDAVAEVKRDPLAGGGSWITRFRAAPPGRKVVLAGSPWFPAYAVDFGSGTPVMVDRASLGQDGEIAIFAGREAGSVEASVAVAAAFHRVFAVKSSSNKSRL